MIPRTNLDIDVLRTFVAGMDLGSFARAADQVGRSQSAVSSQIRKLEEKVGCALVRKSGRSLVLTSAGENLMAFARRILDLNDEAVATIRCAELAGAVRLGLPEDFAEGWLPELLGRFVRSHPKAHVEVQAGRNSALEALVAEGALDTCLLWGARESEGLELLANLPMRWIGDGALVREAISAGLPLPLVVFQGPCPFRDQAVRALDNAGIPWRIAFSSTSLASLWSAAAAGLGVTVRSEIGMPATLTPIEPEAVRLPILPEIALGLWSVERPGNAAARSLVDHMRAMVAARARELIIQRGPRRPRSSAPSMIAP